MTESLITLLNSILIENHGLFTVFENQNGLDYIQTIYYAIEKESFLLENNLDQVVYDQLMNAIKV